MRPRVQEVWDIPGSRDEAEHQLVDLLRRADAQNLPVSIAGARHSMGGHVIAPDGIVINMLPFDDMELDEESNILHVQSGATWKEIIDYLDRHGMSVGCHAVQQLLQRWWIAECKLPWLAVRSTAHRLDSQVLPPDACRWFHRHLQSR